MMERRPSGHISVTNTATPTESGIAMSSARNDETRVPKTNGKAPKEPLTGSQSLPQKNLIPNWCNESCDLDTSSQTTSTTIAKTEIALSRMMTRKTESGSRLLEGCACRILSRIDGPL